MFVMPALVSPMPTPMLEATRDPILLRLLAEAHGQSLDIALASARLEAARVAARAAGAETRPQLDHVGSFERRRNARDGEQAPTTVNSQRLGLEASWEIDLWGRLRKVRAAATREMEAAEADLRGARLLLEAELVRAYQDLRYGEASLGIQERRSAALRGLLAIHRARQESGLATGSERFRTESDLRQAEAETQAVQRELVQIKHRLAMLLGRADATFPDLFPATPSPLPGLPSGLPSTVLGARPDLQAATLRHEAALARVGEARAARLPRLTLTGAYGLASSELKDLARSDSVTWSLGPRLSVPLLDGGRTRSRIEAARVEAERMDVELKRTHQRALMEVAEDLALLEADAQTHAHWEGAALAAERILLSRTAEQQAGRGTGMAIAQAQLQVLALRLQSLQAARTMDQTRVALRLALGCGWTMKKI